MSGNKWPGGKGNFGLSNIKREGYVSFEINGIPQFLPIEVYKLKYGKLPESETTYVERAVPIKYVDEIHLLIDHFLAEHK